jgi:hypothetical protein
VRILRVGWESSKRDTSPFSLGPFLLHDTSRDCKISLEPSAGFVTWPTRLMLSYARMLAKRNPFSPRTLSPAEDKINRILQVYNHQFDNTHRDGFVLP